MLNLTKSLKTPLLFAILSYLFCISDAHAQFNVLSTDTLNKEQIYVELGSTFKPNNQAAQSRFSSFVPRVAYGLTNNVEISFNLLGQVSPGKDETILSPMIKWRVYNSEKYGVAVSVGDNLFIPVRNKSYKFGNQFYVQATKTIAKTATRVTAGSYHFTKNVVAENASRAGGLFGIEQPVTRKFGLAADWVTGKHDAGYATAGFYFSPHKRVVSYVGYSIGNAGARQGNHYFFANVGYTFN